MKPTGPRSSVLSRRHFVKRLGLSSALLGMGARGDRLQTSDNILDEAVHASHQTRRKAGSIDRRSLVERHNPVLLKLDPAAPLSIGNGEFAFTSDITGLQTFPDVYDHVTPLCTMSQWGWHTTPMPPELREREFHLTMFETHGRKVGYAVDADGQADLYRWLRENPHRLHLGRIGLKLTLRDGAAARASDLTDIEQRLDLWTGRLTSRFRLHGLAAIITTAVHPSMDLLAVKIESELIEAGMLAVSFAFPYGSPAMQAADWLQPGKHKSSLTRPDSRQACLHRVLDGDEYFVTIAWRGQAAFAEQAEHQFLLLPHAGERSLSFVVAFSQSVASALPEADAAISESARYWERFWERGAAIELAHSRDPRAAELERRVVLSQYLTAIQCSGSKPPQETGLTVNSWYGKFHLEMHWWHAAHFALWNRTHLLERSLGWYLQILPRAREHAASQGYVGARWPKMTGPEGRDSPSPIGPLLIWQQPHPIFYAELCYRERRDRRTLARYKEIVSQTAEFMASFASLDKRAGRYVLGPPVIPAQENHPPRETWNPTFELSYWTFGLKIAQQWRERLGISRSASWDAVINGLSPLPVRDGVYLAHENCPQTYVERNFDHPSMLAAFGMLPGDGVDSQTMRQTLNLVLKSWQWERTWGWDYPLVAMTAARLGEPGLAIDVLLMDSAKNRYLPNGHNWQRSDLPCYLPANGGLLYAIGLMAAGWRSAPARQAPGFPINGSWEVRAEGFNKSLLATL